MLLRSLSCALIFSTACATQTPISVPEVAESAVALEEEPQLIYFVLTDRFTNGDPDNDGDDPCFDPQKPNHYHGGDLEGVRARLPYIAALGATDVWITPVQRQTGPEAVPAVLGDQCAFHGYWSAFDGEIEPRLGGEQALDTLIEDMHGRGMRLIVDYVVNHTGYGAELTRTHPEWFHREETCDSEETCALLHLPDFAHEREDVARYLADLGARFAERFAFDGIRMDTVKHVPERFFRDVWIPALRPIYLLGELFDEGPYERQRPYLDGGFDALFDFRLRRALIDSFAYGAPLDRVADTVAEAISTLGMERARHRVTLVDNHDVPRFTSEMQGTALQERYLLALAVLFLTPGVPQIQYGNEIGMLGHWPENRRDMPAWAFTEPTPAPGYLGDPALTLATVKALAAQRRRLHAGDYKELWRPGGSGLPVYAFERTTATERFIVVIHNGATPLSMSLPVGDETMEVTMPPYSFEVFERRQNRH